MRHAVSTETRGLPVIILMNSKDIPDPRGFSFPYQQIITPCRGDSRAMCTRSIARVVTSRRKAIRLRSHNRCAPYGPRARPRAGARSKLVENKGKTYIAP
ncbi:hypothetical protein EVAR_44003_1 [Eumeta japonica]|uniref:Uncharacterized protein n=1 Tax=Eumeta variegata TaxID=151549 RepID=A0A4C1XEY3_EUMVA|nr:hypothetical protein EVAR_44003_1 [Eumeta japonica]